MSGAATDQDSGTGGDRPRLDSWKEIATYLKRGARTVRRWERQEGLPVHRHVHGKQATVYAFTNEIDTWLKSRSADEGAVVAQHPAAVCRARLGRTPKRTPQSASRYCHSSASFPQGRSAQDQFADGLTDELILEVGRCCPDRLRVIALTSVMQYKQSPKNVEQIGQELGADYIFEGTIRRYGRRVRLTARLIAARDQANIWADRYEIQLPPLSHCGKAPARRLLILCAARLRGTRKSGRHRPTSTSIAAHSAYIEGTSHFLPTDGGQHEMHRATESGDRARPEVRPQLRATCPGVLSPLVLGFSADRDT